MTYNLYFKVAIFFNVEYIETAKKNVAVAEKPRDALHRLPISHCNCKLWCVLSFLIKDFIYVN